MAASTTSYLLVDVASAIWHVECNNSPLYSATIVGKDISSAQRNMLPTQHRYSHVSVLMSPNLMPPESGKMENEMFPPLSTFHLLPPRKNPAIHLATQRQTCRCRTLVTEQACRRIVRYRIDCRRRAQKASPRSYNIYN